jgi:ankyrin repeat protein
MGNTALFYAAEVGDFPTVQLLLGAGADVTIRNHVCVFLVHFKNVARYSELYTIFLALWYFLILIWYIILFVT